MKLLIANWREHQHYRHKSPPWIKLHLAMLDEYGPDGEPRKFRALPDRAKMLFPFLLLVAARYDGVLPTDSHEWLARQTGLAPESIDTGDLIRAGLLVPATPSDGAGDTQGIRKGYTGDTQGIRIVSDSVATDTEYRDRVQSTEGDARGITEPEPPSPLPPAPDAAPAPAPSPTAPANPAPITLTPPTKETPPKANPRASTPPTAAVRYDSLPDWLRSSPGMSPGIWAAWIDTRRRKRAAVGGSAIDLCLRKLSERQEQSGAYLALAVERGWIGVTWDWFDAANGQQAGPPRARGQQTPDAQDVTPEVAAAQRNRRAVVSVIMGAAKAVGRRLSDSEIKRMISHRCASLPADDIRAGIAQAVNSAEWRAIGQYAEATE